MSAPNATTSGRGTDWRRIISHPGFRAGFEDARIKAPYRREFETRKAEWTWWYEYGRLFAASPCSRRFSRIPSRWREVKPSLVAAACRARSTLDIPPTGAKWS